MGVAEEVLKSEEPITLSPLGHGITLTIPAGTIRSDPDTPAIVTLKTLLPTPAFTYPEGYTPVSAVYNVSAPSSFEERVNLKFEHFANVDNEEHAKKVVVFSAKSLSNNAKECIFRPLENVDANITVGKHHCTVASPLPVFMSAGTLETSDVCKSLHSLFNCMPCII